MTYDPRNRPDPITPKGIGWTLLMTALAAFCAAMLDWKTPASDRVMDWVRSLLPVLLAVAGAVVAATQAKKETTPVEDPYDRFNRKLVPVGTRPDTPDTLDASGRPKTEPFDSGGTLPPGVNVAHNTTGRPEQVVEDDPGSSFFDPQGDRGEHERGQYPGSGPGESPGRL